MTPSIPSEVDYATLLVPPIRDWLRKGASEGNLHSSVRLDSVCPLAGGLKAPVVGRASIHIQLVMKVGTEELLGHRSIMNGVNERSAAAIYRGKQNAVFPEVMSVVKAKGLPDGNDHLMLQQALVGYEPVLDWLMGTAKGAQQAEFAIVKSLPSLGFMHAIPPGRKRPFQNLPVQPDPFSKRIKTRLTELKERADWMPSAYSQGITVHGKTLPPLKQLLPKIQSWQNKQALKVRPVLVHGDPHIANLMVRSRGRGLSVRWIDPNPEIGFSDFIYDWGKLLHFIEPVGLAKAHPQKVQTKINKARGKIQVQTQYTPNSRSAEAARVAIEEQVTHFAKSALADQNRSEASLHLARASAHLGLASLYCRPDQDKPRQGAGQFALAYALSALADWEQAVQADSKSP